MNSASNNLLQLPVKKKRGRPKGSKNRLYRPSGQPVLTKTEPEVSLIKNGAESVKEYCFDIMRKAREKGRQNALVGLLHWFRMNYLDNEN